MTSTSLAHVEIDQTFCGKHVRYGLVVTRPEAVCTALQRAGVLNVRQYLLSRHRLAELCSLDARQLAAADAYVAAICPAAGCALAWCPSPREHLQPELAAAIYVAGLARVRTTAEYIAGRSRLISCAWLSDAEVALVDAHVSRQSHHWARVDAVDASDARACRVNVPGRTRRLFVR